MHALIAAALDRSRTTLLILLFLLCGGLLAYVAMPKESNPDVTIPMIYVSVTLEGISPEDGDRLLVRPLEQELRSLEGVKEMSSVSSEGHSSVTLEFDAGFDAKVALADVREKVDTARSKLPDEADEPTVTEVNVALFPVLSVGLSGPIAETELVYIARRLKENIEGIGEVLSVTIGGDREDLMEIVVDPQVLDSYGIDYNELFNLVSRNNRLVAAGSLDTGAGRMSMKVPGVIEDLEDVMNMPIKVVGDSVVTFADVATIRRTFKDPTGFARINGQPAIVLEVAKRSGANILATIDQVKALMEQAKPLLPPGVEVSYIMDQSQEVQNMLGDLLNNVLTAIVLVLILVVASMGMRSALLVGLTIPGAFLSGILLIWMLGFTLNIVVLFSLILVAGMLVDGAIVVSELADRYLQQGQSPRQAWANAATRMAWPVIASTATTLVVFLPLLFWPGVVGQFMKYLPATVIICLLASLAMALVFLPVLGAVSGGKARPQATTSNRAGTAYRHLLATLLKRPGLTLLGMLALIALIYIGYGRFNHGVEFFPEVEPESAQIWLRARGDLSIQEKDALLRQVEKQVLGMREVKALYARSLAQPEGQLGADVIGTLQFQFVDWHQRRPAKDILAEMSQRTAGIPGVVLEFRKQEEGPTDGKPVKLQISTLDTALTEQWVERIRGEMQKLGGFVDIEDDRALPGIEWRIKVDREAAARFGADVLSVGNAVQMITNGLKLATYRPEDATDEVDIRVRLPNNWRSLDQLGRLTLNTAAGQVPLSNFVDLQPAPKVGTLRRVDGDRTITLQADLADGARLDERLKALRKALGEVPAEVKVKFTGEDADQQEAATFLMTAFLVAIFLMAIILVTQFNSLYQAALVLSAIVLSTAGVLIGLLVNGQSFGIVMVGMGLIALAGIVVNNNIILIDTYNQLRRQGLAPREAALETGSLRLRPVLLTAVTTILGLMPMVLSINVDLLTPSLGFGAPSTQWWTQLSSAIAGGLAFATVLTLLLTPCLLVLGARFERRPPPLETYDTDLLDLPEHLVASKPGKARLQRSD
ncbi:MULTISPECIES: efflux RND transporter permease subunit [Pseudomonas]|uniref:Multidrug efflux pump n=2 Tax=Ectopseudomonas TaxID=3236654 RepID=A0A653AYS0_ECTOL|nr:MULTISPECIES: efflux RND transporter permease subunit [Pseudomonas]CAE6939095.1 Multidrug efflux pump [Pseudomonas oleovorans]QFT23007.1 Multidrug resistance protein MdtB [Pseudomonas sp. THAF187a]QFT43194.1 Multidrug resistance protein MdtB [Pseudomonas sp. THAF42]QTS84929.1 efflux RND transporter permease subunit [Pseudomonas khazarica]WFC63238.1 efflux RND transporter permease subunit [Pseudomonas sp. REST10]|tara:strand:+ start:2678 stop:5824 length:3147 start_codon:yes stop_codon:yes gene_type:complete